MTGVAIGQQKHSMDSHILATGNIIKHSMDCSILTVGNVQWLTYKSMGCSISMAGDGNAIDRLLWDNKRRWRWSMTGDGNEIDELLYVDD